MKRQAFEIRGTARCWRHDQDELPEPCIDIHAFIMDNGPQGALNQLYGLLRRWTGGPKTYEYDMGTGIMWHEGLKVTNDLTTWVVNRQGRLVEEVR
jgi:hypothetical protein